MVRPKACHQRIRAPDSLAHRYYVEDFFYGVRPFLIFADIAGVDTPVARSLMTLAETMVDPDGEIEGRSSAAMGIAGLKKHQLIERVRD